MTQVLELQFEVANGKPFTITVDAPKENLTVGQVYSAMQVIVQQNIFHKDGLSITGLKGARIVERNVSNFDLTALM